MNRTSARRVVAPSVAALALGLAVSACGASNESSGTSKDSGLSGKLDGSGSSAQESAMDAWRAGFQKANNGVTVNYDPAGSGAGVEKFNAGGVDFAGSDAALDAEKGELDAAKQRCGGGDAVEIPNYVSPIAVVYHLDGVERLRLSPTTIGAIFAGTVKTWDDPAIKADNPDADLPDTAIAPVHRSDESGTTKNFTDYLEKAGDGAWKHPADKVWPIKSGEGANQTSGMISAVRGGTGTIGYADLSQVGDLSTAAVKVGDAWVEPSAEGAAKAVEASPLDESRPANDMAVKIDRTTTEDGAYPLMLTSYLIACPTYADKAKAALVKAFLTYVVSEQGQQDASDNAGSAPIPASFAEKAKTIVASITTK